MDYLRVLKNQYFIMRHGQSKANLQGIIISHPENGVHEDYALTELGRAQANTSAMNSLLTSQTILYTSDFSRARETAEIVQKILEVPEIHVSEKLRERHFGNYEKTHSANYHEVWKFDRNDPDHMENGVESVHSVLKRATSLILEIEKIYQDKDILLVAHGDTLQILQTGFLKVSPAQHRSLPHLEVAEIRQLNLVDLTS
jgi:probable phosphoglycerate mutase